MKNLQDLNISANSADSLCTANPRNQQKVQKTCIITRYKAGLSFTRIETNSQCTKQQKFESDQLFTWKIKTGVT